MPDNSPLALNKQAQRELVEVIQSLGGHVIMTNYGTDEQGVGAFAPTAFAFVRGYVPFSHESAEMILDAVVPIQCCPKVRSDGTFASTSNYRLYDAGYRQRWARNAERRWQLQQIQDMPDDPAREWWQPILELR